ncbi:N-acetyltransferase family protein [Cellulomonas sp. Marseille-Q8402]
MQIRRVLEDDWQTVRDIRLRALRENPDVFGSSLTREELFAEPHWRMRLRSASTWVVDEDGTARGLVAMIQEPGSPTSDRHVVQLWVAPEARRRGMAWALLDAVKDAARADGAATVSLWVVDGNHAAGDLFIRAGFVRTNERHALTRDPSQVEERLVLRLT